MALVAGEVGRTVQYGEVPGSGGPEAGNTAARKAVPVMALPKGRLLGRTLDLLELAGIRVPGLAPRALWGWTPECGYVVSRGRDVPIYLRSGVAELGIVGHDIVLESGEGLSELADLGFGRCRIALALPESRRLRPGDRLATRYPILTRRYLNAKGMTRVDVVSLAGAVEGAVAAGLADGVVEVVETGATLAAHGLRAVDTVAESTARLVVTEGRDLSASARRVVERTLVALEETAVALSES